MAYQRVSVDDTEAKRRFVRMAHAAGIVSDDVGRALAGVFCEAAAHLTPKDTNRLANAWIEANNMVADRKLPELPIVASRRRQEFIERLESQLDHWRASLKKWEKWDEFYRRERRTHQRWYREVVRPKLRLARRRVKASERELERAVGTDAFVFVWGRKGGEGKRSRIHTVRHKVYGGQGVVERVRGQSLVTIVNREPHWRIVEKHPANGHPIATARRIVGTVGLRRASRRFVRALKEADRAG